MSQRIKRINELIQRELGAIITKELEFDGFLVSIHDVDVSKDFRDCVIYLGVLGAKHHEQDALDILNKNRAMLQKRLSKRVVLRNTPVLQFRVDDSVERGVRTLNALQEVEDLQADDAEEDADENEPN